MRVLAVSLVVAMVCTQAAQAQSVEPDLKRAIDASDVARLAGDAAAWAKFILDDALFTGSDGASDTKAQLAARMTPTRNTTPPRAVSDEKYRVYGDTVIRTWREDRQGGRADRRIAVWVKQKGQWKLASFQLTLVQ